jgi:hypothetical protein
LRQNFAKLIEGHAVNVVVALIRAMSAVLPELKWIAE